MAITALPTPPTRDDPTNFAARGDAFLAALPTFTTEANAQADTVNIQTALASASAAVAGASSKAALGAANYKGLWSSLTGALAVPASVTHSNVAWLLINNLADVTLSQPGISADWVLLNTQDFQVGDIKQSTVTQDSSWITCDGSEYTTSFYPLLGAALPNTSYDLDNSSATMITTSAGSLAYNGTNTYVMVDGGGTLSSSADGVTWVQRYATSSTTGTLTYVGGYFFLAATRGFYYSTDGITWSFRFLSETAQFREVRFGASVYVALSGDASSNIYTMSSPTGSATVSTAGLTTQNRLYFFGTRFYTLGNANATTNVSYSTNGTTWTNATSVAANVSLNDMDYDGSTTYVVVGGGGAVWSSTNGTSFSSIGAGSAQFNKVVYANSLWVVAGTSTLYSAADPGSLASRTTGLSSIHGLAFGNGKWVIGSGSSSRIAYSTDGTTWTIVTAYKFGDPSTTLRFTPLIYAGGKFVYSNGAAGAVHTAVDAAGAWTVGKNQKWLGLNPNTNNENWYADNGSGTLVLPASTGVITTTDQITYTYRLIASGTITSVNKVDFVGGAWFASGATNGALYRSTDTITWTAVSTLVTQQFTHTNYNGSQYLATLTLDGVSGKVRTSTDGITWTLQTVGGSGNFYKSFWFGGAWIVYNTTQIYRSIDGVTWSLVFTMPSGTIENMKVVNSILFVLSSTTSYKSPDGLGFSQLTFQGTSERKYDIEYFSGKYIVTARNYTTGTLELRASIWSSTDGTFFYPAMMPGEYSDLVLNLKATGATLYALGTNWVYTSKDGVNWARFAVPRVSMATREVALINHASKVVLHTANASFPASTTKFRVPEPTLQMGAPSFIKAAYS